MHVGLSLFVDDSMTRLLLLLNTYVCALRIVHLCP